MSTVRGRIDSVVNLRGSPGISMLDLDEAVFAVSGVMNYQPEIFSGKKRDHLKIRVYADAENSTVISEKVYEAVTAIAEIRDDVDRKTLWVDKIDLGPVGLPGNRRGQTPNY